jgi:histone H3/H4
MSASKKIRTFLPKAKIKQMMQKDEDVGKISADVPIMISRGLELFLEQLVQQAHQIAANRGSKILSAQHLYIHSFLLFAF